MIRPVDLIEIDVFGLQALQTGLQARAICAAVVRGGTGYFLGGVDEVDAVRDGVIELALGALDRVLLAPGHGAETAFGDAQVAGAELMSVHDVDFLYPKVAGAIIGCP